MQDEPADPQTGTQQLAYTFTPNTHIRIQNEWICPELQYSGIVNITYASVYYKFLTFQENCILPYVYSYDEKRFVTKNGRIIYVRKPYCSYVETTEKYKLLSPYQSLMKRDEEEKEAKAGVLAIIETSTNPEFVLINPRASRLPYNQETQLVEYQNIEEKIQKNPANSAQAFTVANDYMDLKRRDINYRSDVPVDLLKRLTVVSKVLNINVEELIRKMKQLHYIIRDSNFMRQLQQLRDNVNGI